MKNEKKDTLTIFEMFSGRFEGPFTAMLDNTVTKMPPLHSRQADGTWAWSKDCDNAGGAVVDANGALVCKTANWAAAQMIACSLNNSPRNAMYGSLLGTHIPTIVGANHPFDFWAIALESFFRDLKTGASEKKTVYFSYASSEYFFSSLQMTFNVINAMKYRSEDRAKKVISYIKKNILPLSTFKEEEDKMIARGLVRQWETMRPVHIHYMAQPYAPCELVPEEDRSEAANKATQSK